MNRTAPGRLLTVMSRAYAATRGLASARDATRLPTIA